MTTKAAPMISAETRVLVQFYDLDPMNIVWHGNYVRFLEQARVTLLEQIGYGYAEMEKSGVAWPVTDMRLRYLRSARLGQEIAVRATLVEYRNRLRIDYRVTDPLTGEVLNEARTDQVGVSITTGALCFSAPDALLDAVARAEAAARS